MEHLILKLFLLTPTSPGRKLNKQSPVSYLVSQATRTLSHHINFPVIPPAALSQSVLSSCSQERMQLAQAHTAFLCCRGHLNRQYTIDPEAINLTVIII